MVAQHDNATWLFERETSVADFPHSSESFWTAIFALFLAHLGARPDPPQRSVQVYEIKDAAKPSFRRLDKMPIFQVGFDDIAVEPSKLGGKYFGAGVNLSPAEGGFRPDLFVRLREATGGFATHILIENKTIRYAFKEDQALKYERLMEALKRQNVHARLLLLTPASPEDSDRTTLPTALSLQSKLGAGFGLLLWEDIIRQMQNTGFAVPGVNLPEWQRYTQLLDTAVEQIGVKA